MKKKKVPHIYLTMEIDGQISKVDFYAETLREWLSTLKIEPNQETVTLNFNLNGKNYSKKYNVEKELPVIRQAVKYAELQTNLVPKLINQYVVDFTQKLSTKKSPALKGREHEIEKIWFYLSQKKRNNIFIIGEKEVGKTALATEIARQIATATCPKEFYDKRVLTLKVANLFNIESELWYKSVVEMIMEFLIKNRNNVVLFIDEAIYMKTDERLIIMLYKCIKKFNIPIIATASESNYDMYFLGDSSLEKYVNYVYVEEPEYKELKPMIMHHIKWLKKTYAMDISDSIIDFAIFTSDLAETSSANPGKVINILDKAFLEAKRKGKTQVDKKSILRCYNTYLKYYEKIPEKEKLSTAYHETGHYLAFVMNNSQKDLKIAYVSILPMMYWEGLTSPYRDIEEYTVYSKEYFLDQIAVDLAGRVAEKRISKVETTGASMDLQNADAVAKAMVMQFGFSENGKNRNRQYSEKDYFLIPEEKKKLIDSEIQDLIDEGRIRAEQIIEENEELLKIIAEKLVVEEILTGEQLQKICEDYKNKKTE